jgi:hypothetical protein
MMRGYDVGVLRRAACAAFALIPGAVAADTMPALGLPPLWKLAAQSHAIIVGTPAVPVDQFEPVERTGHGRYIDFDTRVHECLKGDPCPETIVTRYYIYADGRESPIDQAVVSANGINSVLFLLTGLSSNVDGSANYLAGHTAAALQPATPELVAALKDEVAAQEEILRRFAENFPASKEPKYAEVKSLAEATLSRWRWRQKRAFANLEELGPAAVPAMIMLMDDRRELPIKDISLRNPPGFFEPYRNYGPQVVADALAAILSQITDEHFGSIHNGASEHQRKAAIDGWRVYLHRTRVGDQPAGSSARTAQTGELI